MTYLESPFSQLSDELWHVFGGHRRFPTTREALSGARTVSRYTEADRDGQAGIQGHLPDSQRGPAFSNRLSAIPVRFRCYCCFIYYFIVPTR